jgi:ubiquinone/menaquinone biosynthesis C-methylase UbiE
MAIIREWFFRAWYWYVNNVDRNGEILFMNYGYCDKSNHIPLEPHDEPNRYPIQLYHHLASQVELRGKDIGEVGCGRGGGLAYITRRFDPSTAKGLDLDKRAIKFCCRKHQHNGLSFTQGDAQQLPFGDATFDVLLNVESSHRYPNVQAFFNEVQRVLRPGGHFLFTDFRYDHEMGELKEQLAKSGLKVVNYQLITQEVVEALHSDDNRKRMLVKKLAPKYLHRLAMNFAGTVGSETYNHFASRRYEYFTFVLQKN